MTTLPDAPAISGGYELLTIGLAGLVIFGNRLPGLYRSLARGLRRVRMGGQPRSTAAGRTPIG